MTHGDYPRGWPNAEGAAKAQASIMMPPPFRFGDFYGKDACGGLGSTTAQQQTCERERDREIPERIALINNRVDTLGNGLQILAARLEPALRMNAPVASGSEKKSQPANTALGEQLDAVERRIDTACTVVADILTRLEL